jgi:hypothetical protein
MITAYNVKTKQKGVEMLKAVIDKNGNKCFAKGVDATGQKMCVAIGLANAEKEIQAGNATKGTGW